MTPNLAVLACATRSLLPKIAALAVLLASVSRAEIANFDLDTLPIQTGLFISQTTPDDEQGLRLSSSTGGISLIGSSNNLFCGTMAYIPYLLGSTSITMQIADPNGDGISNIECWLFLLNPAGPNPPAWLARRAVMNGGSADPGLRFVVPTPLPSDVRIVFSQSTDLGAWTEQTRRSGFALGSLWTGSGSARVIESSGSSGRTITLRASVPTGSRPRVFLRNAYEHVSGGGVS